MTKQAASSRRNVPTTIVWPENSVPKSSYNRVAEFAAQMRSLIIYHTTESVGKKVYKKVVAIDGTTGKIILTNYKQHLAPDERTGLPRMSRNISADFFAFR